MKKIILLAMILFCAAAVPARASDIYFGPASAGSNNGTSCANAFSVTDGTHGINVSGNWAAGNTLHLCGTIPCADNNTTLINSQGAGSSGNPITVKFETGAVLTCPAWTGGGTININHAFVTVDGGTNGKIQNTANGSSGLTGCLSGSCTVQQGSTGVSTNAANDIVKNLAITHVYIHASGVTDLLCNAAPCTGIEMNDGSNQQALSNTIDNTYEAVGVSNCAACVIAFNHSAASNHDITVSTGIASNAPIVHDNTTTDGFNWDESDNAYHHNKIMLFANSGSLQNCQVYNNRMTGNIGNNVTSYLFLDGDGLAAGFNGCGIFNNIIEVDSGGNCGADGCMTLGDGGVADTNNVLIANNTVVYNGTTTSNPINLDDLSGTASELNNLWIASPQGASLWTGGSPGGAPTSGMTIDYNIYAGASTASGVWFANDLLNHGFTDWTSAPLNFDAHGSNPNPGNLAAAIISVNLNSSFVPQSPSVAIGAGKNLSSQCGTFPALCFDANGVARSATLAWTVGALEPTGSAPPSTPTIPTGKMPFVGTVLPAPVPALKIVTPVALPQGTIGVAFSQMIATSGGTPPIKFSATGLPAGLSLGAATSTAVPISGTPSVAGTFSPKVTATDSATPAQTVAQIFSLTVALNNPAITASATPSFQVSVPMSVTFSATGCAAVCVWSIAGTLPAGVTFAPSATVKTQATISGSPAAAVAYNFTVQVQ